MKREWELLIECISINYSEQKLIFNHYLMNYTVRLGMDFASLFANYFLGVALACGGPCCGVWLQCVGVPSVCRR